MLDLSELQSRIRILEDIEAIKKAKATYWYCLDKKLWEELPDCFTKDAVADYGPDPKHEGRYEGAMAIAEYCKRSTSRETLRTTHQGHNPRIEIIDEMSARGTWEFYFQMIDEQRKRVFQMGGFYQDEYVKEDGRWKIRVQVFQRTFREWRDWGGG